MSFTCRESNPSLRRDEPTLYTYDFKMLAMNGVFSSWYYYYFGECYAISNTKLCHKCYNITPIITIATIGSEDAFITQIGGAYFRPYNIILILEYIYVLVFTRQSYNCMTYGSDLSVLCENM